MKIAISGASGFIGTHLTSFLTEQHHEVVPLGRYLFRKEGFMDLTEKIDGCQVIINLAGASINKKWTKAYKDELYNSRIPVTRQLVRAIAEAEQKPQLFISTSAVGFYSTEGNYDEYNEVRGDGFLADLCSEWERTAKECPEDVRLVIMRLGVVLAKDGGALPQMLLPLNLTHTSAIIGTGNQAFPWVSIMDVCRMIDFVIQQKQIQGIVNVAAPQCITQKYLAYTLARVYHAWLILPVPSTFFQLIYGEGASFLTEGQTVHPTKLQEAGFKFSAPTIEAFFKSTTLNSH